MKATATKNKQSTSFADLVADSELSLDQVQIGNHSVTIRELTGRERFQLSEREDNSRWDNLLWVAFTGLVEPKLTKPEQLDEIKTEWVVKIANSVLALSGLGDDSVDEAEKELAAGIDIGGS